jgi:hypothetical protein
MRRRLSPRARPPASHRWREGGVPTQACAPEVGRVSSRRSSLAVAQRVCEALLEARRERARACSSANASAEWAAAASAVGVPAECRCPYCVGYMLQRGVAPTWVGQRTVCGGFGQNHDEDLSMSWFAVMNGGCPLPPTSAPGLGSPRLHRLCRAERRVRTCVHGRESSPGADVGGASPVPVLMWAG